MEAIVINCTSLAYVCTCVVRCCISAGQVTQEGHGGKLIVVQLLNKFAVCYGTPRYVTWVGNPQTPTAFWL